MYEILLTAAAVVATLMLATWVVSIVVSDVSIVDIVWGLGFVFVAWASAVATGDLTPRGALLASMTTIWGLRLAGYLFWRKLGEPEDRRYARMRDEHPGSFWWVSLFKVFLLQGVLMWVIALPVATVHLAGGSLYWLDYAGAAIWLAGIFFESVGDYQMARFKSSSDSAGQVLDRGLWRYNRHPNYFGDFLVWWGHYVVALAGGLWWTVVAPVVMSVLLLRVSGVALLEKNMSERRPEYEEYVERTNAFFPGPPSPGG